MHIHVHVTYVDLTVGHKLALALLHLDEYFRECFGPLWDWYAP